MPYHLDTDICAAALRGAPQVQERMRAQAGNLYVSMIVLGELYCGALWSQRPERNLAVLAEFVAGVELIPFDHGCARMYGEICAGLLRAGRPTGQKDALIAAVARTRGATLVTHNTRHFQHIEALQLEDWLT